MNNSDKKTLKNSVMLIFFAIVFLYITYPVSAYSLTDMKIQPQNNIVSGDQVSMRFTITPAIWFSEDNRHYTADPNNTIAITTMLDNPKWQKETVILGQSSSQEIEGSNTLQLAGWDLAYRMIGSGEYGEMVNVTITGTAPNVTETSTVPFINIGEYDKDGNKIQGSDTVLRFVVINKRDLSSALYLAEQDINKFDAEIQEKETLGVDVSTQKIQLANAKTSLEIARQLSPEQYQIALSRLDGVKESIESGTISLDKTLATNEINRASVPLDEINGIVGWFKGNESTVNYPGLDKIVGERGNISILVSSGNVMVQQGQYEDARSQALKAFEIGNRTLSEARILQKHAADPISPLWDNLIYVLIIIFVTGVILLFRPKKKKVKKVKET
jgi:hypothetical protein